MSDTESGDTPLDPLLEVDGLTKHFEQGSGLLSGLFASEQVRAVEDVSFEIQPGETLGLVGESGCGKSTLARILLRLITPTDGEIRFKGRNLAALDGEDLRKQRQDMQMIFQDPQSSLDPRMKVGPIVEEPMRAHGMLDAEGREARARELLEKVGLDPQHYNRYPHQFSGGQRQRINLARALSVNPEFIVCDEPVSALDVSIQAQVLNTMSALQEEFGLTYLFIAHDLSVIRHISDRVAVMYLGQIVELAEKDELFENPQHPYTRALLSSIPVPDPRAEGQRGVLEGDVPSPINPPSGCRFRTRCPALICPTEYDLNETQWDNVRSFTRAVDRRTFEPDAEDMIRKRFFGDVSMQGDAADIVDRAIARVLNDEWDETTRLLDEILTEQELSEAQRDSVRSFVRAVDQRTFESDAGYLLHDRFFGNAEPHGEAAAIVHRAVDAVLDGEWDEANRLLDENFAQKSICAREKPAYEITPEHGSDRHFAACHLHRE